MRILLIFLVTFAVSCSNDLPLLIDGKEKLKPIEEKPKGPIPAEYFEPFKKERSSICVGDVLEISVFGQPGTTAKVKVAPDGFVYYLFGVSVKAEGRFREELSTDIQGRLKRMFNNPEVSVLPISVRSNKFSLIGKVKYPGQYDLISSLTIRQAISQAGGLKDGVFRGTTVVIASLKKSFVIRDNKRIPVDLHALIEKGDTSQNIFVQPGDYIYIASGLAQEVYVLGQVKDPHPAAYNDSMTLISLLTEQGRGFTNGAYLKQVIVLRGDLEKPQAYQVNVEEILDGKAHDLYLQPGDIVYVPEKPYQFAAELTRMALKVFAASIGGRAGSVVSDNIFGRE